MVDTLVLTGGEWNNLPVLESGLEKMTSITRAIIFWCEYVETLQNLLVQLHNWIMFWNMKYLQYLYAV
jgi:hypothetical protein